MADDEFTLILHYCVTEAFMYRFCFKIRKISIKRFNVIELNDLKDFSELL